MINNDIKEFERIAQRHITALKESFKPIVEDAAVRAVQGVMDDELRRLYEIHRVMLDALQHINKLCPDDFHYFPKQKPESQRTLGHMAQDAGTYARAAIKKIGEMYEND